ncbi:hypothetical protein lbkm_2552 [Lachnospiraceae bacterium KM106-2]|nr:hypothetical protein lbkm_2552 [Lachnospiraceae bacterium KM106-2]
MKCFYHKDRDAVAYCTTCGKALCKECASNFNVPQCMDCFQIEIADEKKKIIKSIGISIALFIVGFIYNGNLLYAFYFACIPYGWKALNRITPNVFLWMSGMGWLVYYLTKLFLAIMIGMFALPYTLIKYGIQLKKINRVQSMLQQS